MEKILNILLVDDDLISNAVTSNTLKKIPVSHNLMIFLSVNTIAEYIEKCIFDKSKIDIIFIDLNFPKDSLQGWDLINEIEKKYISKLSQDIKIYILSSSTSKIDIDKAKKYSFVKGFINKPITKDILNILL